MKANSHHTSTSSTSTTSFTPERGFIEGCTKDQQSVTADWEFHRRLIEGVSVKEVKSVLKDSGSLTEIYRSDWGLDAVGVEQIFQMRLYPGGLSAWHCHQFTTDRLFVTEGVIKIVLFDARQNSPTYGLINEFRLGHTRPGLVSVPPGIWHGVQNSSHESALLLNIVDYAYKYEDPDHWRLPHNTDKIPYSFGSC